MKKNSLRKQTGRVCLILVLASLCLWLLLTWVEKQTNHNEATPGTKQQINFDLQPADSDISIVSAPPSSDRSALTSSVFGIVVSNESSIPVAGATVCLASRIPLRRDGSGNVFQDVIIDRQTSLEDGTFRFEQVPTGNYQIYAEKENLLSFMEKKSIQKIEIHEDDIEFGPITLELFPVKELLVRVINANNQQPLAGARVRLDGDLPIEKTTDTNGLTRFALSEEAWQITAKAPGFAVDSHLVHPTDSKNLLQIALRSAQQIQGTAFDRHGTPLENVVVQASGLSFRERTVTGPDGQFLIDHLPSAESLTLSANALGYFVWKANDLMLNSKDRPRIVDIYLDPLTSYPRTGWTLSGTLENEDSDPIAEGQITLSFINGMIRYQEVSADDGRFQITGIPIFGSRGTLTAKAEGYAATKVKIEDEIHESISVVMKPGFTVRGIVTDEAGQPVPDAQLKMQSHYQESPLYGEVFKTNIDGRFEISHVPNEPEFDIWAEGFTSVEDVVLDVGRHENVVVLPPQGRLFGTVVDRDNEPVQDFLIKLGNLGFPYTDYHNKKRQQLSKDGLVFTNPKGSFEIEGLMLGEGIDLFVWSPDQGFGYFEGIQTRRIDEEPLSLKLKNKKVDLAGVVRHVDGEPAEGLQVVAVAFIDKRNADMWIGDDIPDHEIPTSLDQFPTFTDSLGRFTIQGLPGNRPLALKVFSSEVRPEHLWNLEKLSAKDQQSLTIQVKPSSRIFGRINQEVFPGKNKLEISHQSTYFAREIWNFGINGEYALDFVPHGMVTFEMYADTGRGMLVLVQKEEVELEKGVALEKNFGFEPRHTLSGFVFLNGEPLANGWIHALSVSQRRLGAPMTRSGEDGSFQINGLLEDQYRLFAIPGNRSTSQGILHEETGKFFEIKDSDVVQNFYFEESSLVHGRLYPTPGTEAWARLVPRGQESLYGWRTTIEADGSFAFESVPAGEYDLYYESYRGTKSFDHLLQQLNLDSVEKEINLGTIPLSLTSKMLLQVERPKNRPSMGLYFDLFQPGANPIRDAPAIEISESELTSNQVLIHNLPPGTWQLIATTLVPELSVRPDKAMITFSDQATTPFNLQIVGNTRVHGLLNANPTSLVRAEITHLGSGQSWTTEATDFNSFGLGDGKLDLPFVVLSKDELIAIGLPEGLIQIQVSDENGNILRAIAALEEGKKVEVYLTAQQE